MGTPIKVVGKAEFKMMKGQILLWHIKTSKKTILYRTLKIIMLYSGIRKKYILYLKKKMILEFGLFWLSCIKVSQDFWLYNIELKIVITFNQSYNKYQAYLTLRIDLI